MNNDTGAARNTDPETSHEAAERFNPTELRQMIYRIVAAAPFGLIYEQVESAVLQQWGGTNNPHSVSPRLCEMARLGMIERDGETRLSSSNRQQLVIRALPPPFVPAVNGVVMSRRQMAARIVELEREVALLKGST